MSVKWKGLTLEQAEDLEQYLCGFQNRPARYGIKITSSRHPDGPCPDHSAMMGRVLEEGFYHLRDKPPLGEFAKQCNDKWDLSTPLTKWMRGHTGKKGDNWGECFKNGLKYLFNGKQGPHCAANVVAERVAAFFCSADVSAPDMPLYFRPDFRYHATPCTYEELAAWIDWYSRKAKIDKADLVFIFAGKRFEFPPTDHRQTAVRDSIYHAIRQGNVAIVFIRCDEDSVTSDSIENILRSTARFRIDVPTSKIHHKQLRSDRPTSLSPVLQYVFACEIGRQDKQRLSYELLLVRTGTDNNNNKKNPPFPLTYSVDEYLRRWFIDWLEKHEVLHPDGGIHANVDQRERMNVETTDPVQNLAQQTEKLMASDEQPHTLQTETGGSDGEA